MNYVPVMIHDHGDDYDVFTIEGHNRWFGENAAKLTARKIAARPYDAGIVDSNGRIYSYEWPQRKGAYDWRHFGDMDVSDLDMKP